MKMTGEQRIGAPRSVVWSALNDPEILKKAIPGCQSLEKLGADRMKATVAVKVGPITARFNGDVTLLDLDPPNGYRIRGEGNGGAAGVAKGEAVVRLIEDGGATLLQYEVDSQVGGKLAQLGGGLIDATAKQMAGAFFSRFSESVVPNPAATVEAAKTETVTTPTPAHAIEQTPRPQAPFQPSIGASVWSWQTVLAIAVAALVGFLVGRFAAGWDGSGSWAATALGLLVVLVAFAGFGYGRQATAGAPPTIIFDNAVLAQLVKAATQTKES